MGTLMFHLEPFRAMDAADICCSDAGNLIQGTEQNKVIDGCWICKKCSKVWIGHGEDEYLNHELETLTPWGVANLNAIDAVIREGKKPLRYAFVLEKMKEQAGE